MRSKFRPGSRSLLRATTYFGTSLVNYHYAAIRELEVRTGKKNYGRWLKTFVRAQNFYRSEVPRNKSSNYYSLRNVL